MQSGILKHVALAFLMAVTLYVVAYGCDRHLRLRRGPWQVSFTAETNGTPAVIIRHAKLGVEEFKIIFAGEQLPASFRPATVVFDTPAKPPPFGQWVFDDLMWLPGTVTLNLFGHGVQLLPRTLTVDVKEHAWQPRATLTVTPAEKRPPENPKSRAAKKP
ncbi:MAG: hypothetical protein HZA89_03510 [Verrucomicrobia bacterium]|nr:hypothetical protein [Verrucomicrobiota bacterium]